MRKPLTDHLPRSGATRPRRLVFGRRDGGHSDRREGSEAGVLSRGVEQEKRVLPLLPPPSPTPHTPAFRRRTTYMEEEKHMIAIGRRLVLVSSYSRPPPGENRGVMQAGFASGYPLLHVPCEQLQGAVAPLGSGAACTSPGSVVASAQRQRSGVRVSTVSGASGVVEADRGGSGRYHWSAQRQYECVRFRTGQQVSAVPIRTLSYTAL